MSSRRVIVILNSGSGTADKRTLVDTVRGSLSRHGIDPDVQIVAGGPALVRASSAAAASDADIVVAGGGDGTIATVAKPMIGTGKSLGVLPLGTFNYFARNHRVPLDLVAALDLIATTASQPVDVGEVNGHVFLNNASIGLYPTMLVHRESTYRRFGRSQLIAYASAMAALLSPPGLLNLTMRVDGQLMPRRTPMLFVGTNIYQLESFAVPGRGCLGDGRMVLYVTRPLGMAGMFSLAARAIVKGLHGASEFEVVCAREVVVALRRRRVGVAMDGEVKHLDAPLRFAVRREGLNVIGGPVEGESAACG